MSQNVIDMAAEGSSIEAEFKRLSPAPDDFPNFVQRIAVPLASQWYGFGAGKLMFA